MEHYSTASTRNIDGEQNHNLDTENGHKPEIHQLGIQKLHLIDVVEMAREQRRAANGNIYGDQTNFVDTKDGNKSKWLRIKGEKLQMQDEFRKHLLKGTLQSKNPSVTDNYNNLVDAFNQETLRKKRTPRLFAPMPNTIKAKDIRKTTAWDASNLKENKKIREIVIHDHLEGRRSTHAKKVSFLEYENPLYPKKAIRKMFEMENSGKKRCKPNPRYKAKTYDDALTLSAMERPKNVSDLFNENVTLDNKCGCSKGDLVEKPYTAEHENENKKFKDQTETMAGDSTSYFNSLRTDARRLVIEKKKEKDVLEGLEETTTTTVKEDNIKENEKFFVNLKREMAASPLNIRNKKHRVLERQQLCFQTCNRKKVKLSKLKDI